MPSLSLPYDPAIGPLIHVSFTQAGALSATQGKALAAQFLIDTGASVTSIAPQMAEQIGLRSLGKVGVSVPSGVASLNSYLVDLLVIFGDPPNGFPPGQIPTFPAQNLPVIAYMGNLNHYQGLLGRDILNLGVLKTDGPGKQYTLTLPDLPNAPKILGS